MMKIGNKLMAFALIYSLTVVTVLILPTYMMIPVVTVGTFTWFFATISSVIKTKKRRKMPRRGYSGASHRG